MQGPRRPKTRNPREFSDQTIIDYTVKALGEDLDGKQAGRTNKEAKATITSAVYNFLQVLLKSAIKNVLSQRPQKKTVTAAHLVSAIQAIVPSDTASNWISIVEKCTAVPLDPYDTSQHIRARELSSALQWKTGAEPTSRGLTSVVNAIVRDIVYNNGKDLLVSRSLVLACIGIVDNFLIQLFVGLSSCPSKSYKDRVTMSSSHITNYIHEDAVLKHIFKTQPRY